MIHFEKDSRKGSPTASCVGILILFYCMVWGTAWASEALGELGPLAISICYGILFIFAGRRLWAAPAPETRTIGGLLFTLAIFLVPVATNGLENLSGFWRTNNLGNYRDYQPFVNVRWLIMEVATIIAGVAALRFWRFPFLTAPIAFSLWFMAYDLAALFGPARALNLHEREMITTLFGAVILLASYVIDLKTKAGDIAFWGYLFGLLAFWSGFIVLDIENRLNPFIYLLINLFLIFCSLVLCRWDFAMFGSIGAFVCFNHICSRFFSDSTWFLIAQLSFGLGIAFATIQYHRHHDVLERKFRERLQPYVGRWIPPRVFHQ